MTNKSEIKREDFGFCFRLFPAMDAVLQCFQGLVTERIVAVDDSRTELEVYDQSAFSLPDFQI